MKRTPVTPRSSSGRSRTRSAGSSSSRARTSPVDQTATDAVSGALPDPAAAPTDGRRARWAAHRRERRDELLDAVIEAVRRHGAQLGMDQIAESAGTSKAVFYRYFADKADLYRRVGQRLAGILLRDIAQAVDEQSDDVTMLRAGVDAYLKLLDEDPELYRFVVHNPLLGDASANAVADYSAMIAELISTIMGNRLDERGLTSDAVPMWGVAVVGAVRAAGDWWIEHPGGDRGQLTDQLVALLWNGMSVGGGGGEFPLPDGLLRPVEPAAGSTNP